MSENYGTERVLRAIGIRAGPRNCVIYEKRGRQLAIALLLVVIPFLVYAGIGEFSDMPMSGRAVLTFLSGLLVFVALCYLVPWNARIRVDFDEGTGRVSWRFFFVPLRRADFALEDRRFSWGRGPFTVTRTVKSDASAIGCLAGLALGPLSLLLSASKTEREQSDREGIGLHDPVTGDYDLLLPVRDRESVHEVLLVLSQLFGAT